jgi:hypothetical protein
MYLEPTEKEAKAIRALQRLADKWPDTLWLFSCSGSLLVMRKDDQGHHAHVPGGGVNIDYELATIRGIDNDGGDV